ncbi:hypothetical protein [Methanosarcina barkeri]|nr:hypothetical protein [Methanosarcina barkeri]
MSKFLGSNRGEGVKDEVQKWALGPEWVFLLSFATIGEQIDN